MDNQTINIALPVAVWNVVLSALGARPFSEVAQIIEEIKGQASAQLAPAAEPSVPEE